MDGIAHHAICEPATKKQSSGFNAPTKKIRPTRFSPIAFCKTKRNIVCLRGIKACNHGVVPRSPTMLTKTLLSMCFENRDHECVLNQLSNIVGELLCFSALWSIFMGWPYKLECSLGQIFILLIISLITLNIRDFRRTSVTLPSMLNTRLIYVLIFALAFLGVASAAEVRHVHDADSSQSIEIADVSGDQSNDAPDHCKHCCHAHASGLLQSDYSICTSALNDTLFSEEIRIHNSSQGPPTPPPNTNIIWFFITSQWPWAIDANGSWCTFF